MPSGPSPGPFRTSTARAVREGHGPLRRGRSLPRIRPERTVAAGPRPAGVTRAREASGSTTLGIGAAAPPDRPRRSPPHPGVPAACVLTGSATLAGAGAGLLSG